MAREDARRRFSRLPGLLSALIAINLVTASPACAQSPGRVFVTDVDGVIGIAASRQIARAIAAARDGDGTALIVRLDTPGGLVSSTRDIIKEMIASPVPIIVYVAPSGARAASAGTFIVYASHVAAMAPGTNMGAATPIEIGGVPGLPQPADKKSGKKEGDKSAAEQKAINDLLALIRSLAQLRGRNAEWADKAVREAATLTAMEARREGVIEVVATGIDDLLTQVDGRHVVVNGVERVLATKGASPVGIEPDWRTRALSLISDPNIAFILLLIGIYGIILEFWHPGTFAPGVIGAISLILALTALSTLPVHYGALVLLILGIGLMIGEAVTPGFGILGIGGLAAFLIGSIFLFEGPDSIDLKVSLPLIVGAALTTAALIFGIVGVAVKARRRPATTGSEQLLGSRGEVVTWTDLTGSVRLLGEIWAARSSRRLQPGDAVRVVGREGLTLIVEP